MLLAAALLALASSDPANCMATRGMSNLEGSFGPGKLAWALCAAVHRRLDAHHHSMSWTV